jgi:hypothetical protein
MAGQKSGIGTGGMFLLFRLDYNLERFAKTRKRSIFLFGRGSRKALHAFPETAPGEA